MNIGDKVRSLKGKEEGYITKFLPYNQVEVEIEDGFRIPFERSDLVLVAKEEEAAFGTNEGKSASAAQTKTAPLRSVFAEKGIFLAFVHLNDQHLEVYLINNTDLMLPYTFGDERFQQYFGIATGGLAPRNFKKVHEVNMKDFENWPALLIHILPHRHGLGSYRPPIVKRMRFKASSFYQHKAAVPLVKQEGYLFQLDDDKAAPAPMPTGQQIAERMMDRPSQPEKTTPSRPHSVASAKGQSLEIDLHAEALGIDTMEAGQIFSRQLMRFESELDSAIVNGYDEVVFIHGVGNGKLKSEIQKRLSGHVHVSYFKDARKEKFGYGATAVRLK